MKNNKKIVNWRRIRIPKYVFDFDGYSYIKTKKRDSLVQESTLEIKKEDWLWAFPNELHSFFGERDTIKLVDGSRVNRCAHLKDKEVVVENLMVEVEEHANAKIILDYYSDDATNSKVFSKIMIKLGKNSTLEIDRVQRMSSNSAVFLEILVDGDEYSNVLLNDMQMGAGYKAITTETHLKSNSKCEYYPLFIGDYNTSSDLSYTAYHRGYRSNSIILGRGVLKEGSKKVFRGNLHFEQGSKKSVGREEEKCILFDDNIKSDSIPALMCDEDDVIGEHAASIGKFDENAMFYIMSRGFSEGEAKILIATSIFEEVIDRIDDQEFGDKIRNEIVRRFGGL